MQIKAFAKINLCLNILGKRPDGYHELQSIMQSVSLADMLSLEEKAEGIIIKCDNKNIPCDASNTVYKAAALLKDKYNIKQGILIDIKKNIPWGAGLAGGSADAAAALFGLNKLWKLNLTQAQLLELGAQIGSDVPFCLQGGTVLVTGRGEHLQPISLHNTPKILLVVPEINVSTAWAYTQVPRGHVKPAQDLAAVGQQGLLAGSKLLKNDLEEYVCNKYEEILELKNSFKQLSAVFSLMSGSGAAVFGIFSDQKALKGAHSILKNKYKKTFIVEPMPSGMTILN
ncbi:4-(cytidine 5'-diphospho)-2-C-methyl-D-erythritol kinase [Candidatus Margulisiibacteriota bacterium]